jgi:serine/threonine protein kinase
MLLAGRYEVGPVVGRGGMGDVHEAVDTRLDRAVAVKILRPEMAARPEMLERFESEARSAGRLSHPNVVTVYDTGDQDGVAYIVMERLPGRTMADVIAAGPVDQGWLRGVAAEVLAALSAAHGAGIIHRDVKPGNVMFTEDGRAKVGDFGIAKTVEPVDGHTVDVTAPHLMLGTPAYLAPERVQGQPASPRSDLYSVGVVLYEALAGRKPFAGDTPMAVAVAACHTDPEPLVHVRPDVDPALAVVVERAMQRDPAARFGSADEMAAALRATDAMPVDSTTTLVDAPTSAAAAAASGDHTQVLTGVAPVGGRGVPAWVRRRRSVVAATMVIVALAVVVAAAVMAWGHRGLHPATADTVTSTSVPVTTAPPTTAAPLVQVQVTLPNGKAKHHRKGQG